MTNSLQRLQVIGLDPARVFYLDDEGANVAPGPVKLFLGGRVCDQFGQVPFCFLLPLLQCVNVIKISGNQQIVKLAQVLIA